MKFTKILNWNRRIKGISNESKFWQYEFKQKKRSVNLFEI